MLDKDHSF